MSRWRVGVCTLGRHTRVTVPGWIHTQDRGYVALVVKRWLDLQEVLGLSPIGVHSLKRLRKSC